MSDEREDQRDARAEEASDRRDTRASEASDRRDAASLYAADRRDVSATEASDRRDISATEASDRRDAAAATTSRERDATSAAATTRRDRRGWGLGIVLAVVTVVAAVQTIWTQTQDAAATDCLTTYAAEQADALEVRTVSLAQTQTALDKVLMAATPVLAAGEATAADGRALREAVADYRAVRRVQIVEQRRNPYPPPPREVC